MAYPMGFPPQGVVAAAAIETVLPTYTVYRENATYYAVNNSTGDIDHEGADPAVVVQACLTAGGAGTVVGMREGNFVALTGVAATANNQGVYGLGEGTYWDATALLTGVHGFTISGFTGVELRHFAIETLAGGTLVNHCVFIEDGANNFHLIDLTIIDSDSDGIHVEGTTITQGHIHRCHVEGADGAGIIIDMDAANFMYRLHIEDCDVGFCGVQGIEFATSGGNLYCEVINNVIYSCTGEGIKVVDGDYSMVRGNICILNGADGIDLSSTEHAQVLGNTCQGNTRSGIYLGSACGLCTISNNVCPGNTRYGIELVGIDDCTVVGNSCLGNTKSGIGLTTASDRNTVVGNTFSENGEHGMLLHNSDFNVVVGNNCNENDSGETGTFDGIQLYASDRTLILGNRFQNNNRWGVMVDTSSNYNKVSNNYTDGNTAGSIRIDDVGCNNNQVEFNTVEEGAPVDAGTGTRVYGNYDPSADAFVGNVGVAPW